MPIYEYRCPECGHTFEKLVKMNASTPPCPECGHQEVTKLVSASGFILKGSGWYKDHYGLKKPSGSGASESKSSTATAEKPAAKSAGSSSTTKSASAGAE